MTKTFSKAGLQITTEFTAGDTIVVTDSGGNTLTWTSPATYAAPTGVDPSPTLLSFIDSLANEENISISGKMQLTGFGQTLASNQIYFQGEDPSSGDLLTYSNFLLGNDSLTISSVVAGGSNATGALSFSIGTVNASFTNILARSPYNFGLKTSTGASSLSIELLVDDNNIFSSNQSTMSTLELTSTMVNSYGLIDLSPFTRDYLANNFDGVYKTKNSSAIATEISPTGLQLNRNFFVAFDGYGYFEDGYNPELTKALMQSNTNISKLDDSPVRVPVLRNATSSVQFSHNGEMVYSTSVHSSTSCDEQILYISNVVSGFDSFMQRVLLDGGVFENNSCIENFEDANTIYPVDTIYINGTDGTVDLVTVTNVEECKYEPYKITFVNKFGALQDLWFYKRANLSTEVENEQYRASVVSGSVTSGVLSVDYSTSVHQYKNIYSSGKELLELNSGFYPESYNEVFKQLMLSEETWINYDNKTLPVNIKTSSIKYKTQLDDKLINYNIEVDFAFDKINLAN
jgi:hypothetical protein